LNLSLRKILGNTAWLSGLQLAFYLLPLVTVPIVTRAFGPELFGFLVTSTAAAGYVGLFIAFGFGWSGPRLVARHERESADLSADVSAILGAQLLIAVAASAVFVLWTLLTRESQELRFAQWAILASTVLNSLVPAWLFLGLERMKDLVIPQLMTRLGASLAILVLIRKPSDLLLYTLITAAGSAAGLIMFLRLMSRVGIRFERPSVRLMQIRLKESATLFVTNVAISAYTMSNVLIVSLLLGNRAAGIFGLADRVRQAAVSALVPLTQAIYPYICRTSGSGDPEERAARRRMFQLMIAAGGGLGLIMFVAAPVAVAVLGGQSFEAATVLVRIFAAVPILVIVSNILGVQIMLPLGMDRRVAEVTIYSALLGVALQLGLTHLFGLSGSASSYVVVELFVCLGFATALFSSRHSQIARS
jgi:O-antigen/teichoic acid export membrane protein